MGTLYLFIINVRAVRLDFRQDIHEERERLIWPILTQLQLSQST